MYRMYGSKMRSCIFDTSAIHGSRMPRAQDDIQEVLVSREDRKSVATAHERRYQGTIPTYQTACNNTVIIQL